MHRVRMLKHFGVNPYIVFDGDRLPSKAATEKERAARRAEAKSAGLRFLQVGKANLAHVELQKAVDITPDMAKMFMEALDAAHVQYVVAPYEADAQMVYLERKGFVDGIVSEDSDLLVFGAQCLLTKLDQYGECVMVNKNHFTACREVNLTGWSDREFRTMAILSGCDYLAGIHRMGLKTAHRLVRKYKTLEHVLKGAMLEGKLRIPPNYQHDFIQAENTFLYQWVFCPEAESLVHLTDIPGELQADKMSYIGAYVDSAIAQQVAQGILNPMTKERIVLSRTPTAASRQPLHQMKIQAVKSKNSNKPIDTFFKSKRVPLAELDPNLFAPSQNQQRLLSSEQNRRSWPSRHVTGSINQRIESSGRSYSVPTRNHTTTSHPPKRRRLCDDSPTKAAAQTERSRFFGEPTGSSSGVRMRKVRPKANKFDFNINSDDSVESTMIEISNTQTSKTTKGPNSNMEDHEPSASHILADSAAGITNADEESRSEHEEEQSLFSESLKQGTRAMRQRTSLDTFALRNDTPKENSTSSARDTTAHRLTLPQQSLPDTPQKPHLVTPKKVSTAPKLIQDHNEQEDKEGSIIFESPPTQPRPSGVASALTLPTPTWIPDDSGYGSQLESLVPEVKGSEDCIAPSSDDSRHADTDAKVQVVGSPTKIITRTSRDDDEGVSQERRPAWNLSGFVFSS